MPSWEGSNVLALMDAVFVLEQRFCVNCRGMRISGSGAAWAIVTQDDSAKAKMPKHLVVRSVKVMMDPSR